MSYEESIEKGELIIRAKREKSPTHWCDIAWAVHFLHGDLLELTEIEDDDDPDFMRDTKYRAGLDNASKQYPGLTALIRDADKRHDLIWLREHASQVLRWVDCQPLVRAQLNDTTPRSIRSLYARLDGGNFKPTKEQLAELFAEEDAKDQEEREHGEKLRLADEVIR
jgi:hypothetical protein